jgi:hypothetical protein
MARNFRDATVQLVKDKSGIVSGDRIRLLHQVYLMDPLELGRGDSASKKQNAPSNLTSFACLHPTVALAYLVLAATTTFQLVPGRTSVSGPRLATRDIY